MPQVKVPLWVHQQTFGAYGSMMPQRTETLRKDIRDCNQCQITLWRRQDENYWYGDGKYYCDGCVAEKMKNSHPGNHSAWNRIWEGDSFVTQAEDRAEIKKMILEVPRGNLDEQEYRFWIGKEETISLFSACRACGDEMFGADARLAHKTKRNQFKGDNPCTVVLTMCYARLLAKRKCVVCHEDCFNRKRYGVPICSPACLKRWKFENREWYGLAMEIMQEYPQKKDNIVPITQAD